MANFRIILAVAACACVALPAHAKQPVTPQSLTPAKPAMVSASAPATGFFSVGAKVAKKRRGEVSRLAPAAGAGAPASVAQGTNFLQIGLIVAGVGAAAGAAAAAGGGTTSP